MNKIVCDKCKHEFFVNAVLIKEKDVKIDENKSIILCYFECPKCRTIYKICLKDSRYYELKNDVRRATSRIKNNKGKCSVDIMNSLIVAANVKKQRLANHVKKLDEKYPGVFTYSPIKKEEIIYRENCTE